MTEHLSLLYRESLSKTERLAFTAIESISFDLESSHYLVPLSAPFGF